MKNLINEKTLQFSLHNPLSPTEVTLFLPRLERCSWEKDTFTSTKKAKIEMETESSIQSIHFEQKKWQLKRKSEKTDEKGCSFQLELLEEKLGLLFTLDFDHSGELRKTGVLTLH